MTTMKIVKLSGGHAFGLEGRAMAASNEPMDHITNLDQYELSTANLKEFNVLVITDFIDQEFLFEKKQIIEEFLNDGKIVIACTHIFRAWLPGVNLFMPKKIKNHTDYDLKVINEHSIFHGVDMNELAVRKGVYGFYARGITHLRIKMQKLCLHSKMRHLLHILTEQRQKEQSLRILHVIFFHMQQEIILRN